MLRLFDFGVICYKIKNGRNILVWLASWGGSLPGQLRYVHGSICVAELAAELDFAGEEARALSTCGCYPMSTIDF